MIAVLILGWFLTLFHIDTLLASGLNEVFKTEFTTNVYWLIVIALAIIVFIINTTRRRNT